MVLKTKPPAEQQATRKEHESEIEKEFSWIENEFLINYLRYTDNVESPRLMHLWAALSGIAATIGRRARVNLNIGNLYPNLYVLLVGPPGTRKSTAINTMLKFVKNETDTQLAPDDTSGQRQGLIAALQGAEDEEWKQQVELLEHTDAVDQVVEHVSNLDMRINDVNKHHMFVVASEFGSFLGQNNLALTRFLVKMWDGEDYVYQLKSSKHVLRDALLNMIGGTTSTDIATLLPPEAIGQGFMSRIILVYESRKQRRIPPSKAGVNQQFYEPIAEVFREANQLNGLFELTDEANELSDHLYMQDVKINDTRFIYYSERRHTHLLKLSAVLAATRGTLTIEADDIEQADILLSVTEESMPDALGEYGLSPIAAAKQKMLEFIQHANGPVTDRVLWLVMNRDMRLVDFHNALSEMVNAGKIIAVDTRNGKAFVYNDRIQEAVAALAEESIEDLIAEELQAEEAEIDEQLRVMQGDL